MRATIRRLRDDEGELPSSSTLVEFDNDGIHEEEAELELRSESTLLAAGAVSDELCG
jgi:hypothetical protein